VYSSRQKSTSSARTAIDQPWVCCSTELVGSFIINVYVAHFIWKTKVQYANTLQFTYSCLPGHRVSTHRYMCLYITISSICVKWGKGNVKCC
jgi:hypothetical protein